MKISDEINQLLNLSPSIFREFHEKTKIKRFVTINNSPESWKEIFYKGYFRFGEIKLPKPKLPEISIKDTLLLRHSSREFSKTKLSLKQLSPLVYYSAGLKDKDRKFPYSFRFYPSGGARYPLELYLISLNTELPKGIYHYYLKSNSLEKLLTFKSINLKKYFNQSWMGESGCLMVMTAVFNRNTIKYGDRGYRHVLIEAGHVGQNIYLNSAALNLVCCGVGGFKDDELNKLLDLEGAEESVVNVLAVGNPK